MKTTLNWYKREANSYSLTAMRLLIKDYKYKGAYLYIALCDTLVTLPNCVLDVKNDTDTIELLCLDLDFEIEDFIEFINKLLKYKLLVECGNFQYSTEGIQDSLVTAMEGRAKAYERKYKKKPKDWFPIRKAKSSPEPVKSSPEPVKSSPDHSPELQIVRPNFSQSREEKIRKENIREENIREESKEFALSVFNNDFLKELFLNFDLDENQAKEHQNNFLKFFKMSRKNWKDEEDFRSHFLFWLKKELNNLKKQKNANTTSTSRRAKFINSYQG